jgi:hypothetical protein
MRKRALLSAICVTAAAACGTDLPEGTTSITVGRTIVRTDSVLDLVGVVYRLADSAAVPVRGPVRHWFQALTPVLDDSAFALGRAPGPIPASLLLETWAAPDLADSACGTVAPGERLCATGNHSVRASVRRFIAAAQAFGPRAAPIALEGVHDDARRRDLADVYVALTAGKSLDSTVMAYAGMPDLAFQVVLARTISTGSTTPSVDPARARDPARTIFLTPDGVYPTRSYRSPNYVWLALGHQMVHEVVRRLLVERPDLLEHGWHLREATEQEMARVGYAGAYWEDILAEQLARALTIRVLGAANPTITWAARAEALNTDMALVPWLEDVLAQYEAARDTFPTLASFAPRLGAALDRVPLDSCRSAPAHGTILAGVEQHRAVVLRMAEHSALRRAGLLLTDTVVAIDGDSISALGLLTATRQLTLKWASYLPYELAEVAVRRRGGMFGVHVPILWEPRFQVRVASQRQVPRAPGEALPICRWVRRAVRR